MSRFPTCQVCDQQFSLKGPTPFLLPCLHCVCETCVTSAAGGVISCNTCHRDVNLTESLLQKDVITEKEILHLTAQLQPELVLCTREDDGDQAMCWCKDCEDFLCENCQKTHDSSKQTKQHPVYDVGKLQPEELHVDKLCSEHPKYILDVWDEQCRILICRYGKDRKHAGHKTVDLDDDTVVNARREVADFRREVQALQATQETYLPTIDADLQDSDEIIYSRTENISNTFYTLKTLIDQREKELQIELQKHKKIRKELEACQKKCQTTSDYISKTLQYSSRYDIMSLRHILQSKTGECIRSAQAIFNESPPLPRFNTDGLEKITTVLAGFGAIASNDNPESATQTSECGSQTEDWTAKECENLQKELVQLRTTHEKEIQSLRETLTWIKEEEKNGLYRLTLGASDVAYLLSCTNVEFSRAKYNAQLVGINSWGELVNKAQDTAQCSDQRLKRYQGTSSIKPLFRGTPQYFEVKTNLDLHNPLTIVDLLLEIGLAGEEEQDLHHWIGKHPGSFSLTVAHCANHSSICRRVWRHNEPLMCLPDTLENIPGTSATLHYGVVYHSVRKRIAFLDVKNEKIIGKIDNVESSVPLWPMFGVYNSNLATVNMLLVVDRDIDMTEGKKEMILESLS